MRKIHDLSVIIDGTGGDSGLEGGQLNQFENDVERHLRECASTVVGKAVFTKIRAHGRVLMIPYTLSIDRFFKTGPINALSLGSYDSYRFGLGTAAKLGPFDLLHTNVVCFSPRRLTSYLRAVHCTLLPAIGRPTSCFTNWFMRDVRLAKRLIVTKLCTVGWPATKTKLSTLPC